MRVAQRQKVCLRASGFCFDVFAVVGALVVKDGNGGRREEDGEALDAKGNTRLLRVIMRVAGNPARVTEKWVNGEVAAGVDINKANLKGETALSYAVHLRNVGLIGLLIKAGADVNKEPLAGVDSPLLLALRLSDREEDESVMELLRAGADVNARDGVAGTSPLMVAAQGCNISLTRELLARGARPNDKDKDGKTALTLCVESGGAYDKEVARQLLDAGADVNAADGDGKTALMASLERSTVFGLSMFNLLIERGADITALDGNGDTILRWAPGVDFIRSRVESELKRALLESLEVSVEGPGGAPKRGPGSV